MKYVIVPSSQLGNNWTAEHHIERREWKVVDLKLERKSQQPSGVLGGGAVMMTPSLGTEYWSYRVKLTEKQAVVGFPKFGVIGIGFAVEGYDWNVNLPSGESAENIAALIGKNKGDNSISDADVIAAIRLIQEAVEADRKDMP